MSVRPDRAGQREQGTPSHPPSPCLPAHKGPHLHMRRRSGRSQRLERPWNSKRLGCPSLTPAAAAAAQRRGAMALAAHAHLLAL